MNVPGILFVQERSMVDSAPEILECLRRSCTLPCVKTHNTVWVWRCEYAGFIKYT